MSVLSRQRLAGRASARPTPPELVFLAIGSVAGVIFALATPPFRGADEPAHFRRAYQVSEGGIFAERREDRVGGLLPSSLQGGAGWSRVSGEKTGFSARIAQRPPLRPHDRVFVDFRNTAVYTPLPYLPHALAIGLGRAVELSPVILLYVGRIAGLAASLALAFLAIRITPVAKRVFWLLALTPMAIRQMSLVSADSVTNGACLLLLAMFLRLALEPGAPPAGRPLAGLVLSSLAVSLSKVAYLPLSFLCLLGPVDKLGGRRRSLALLAVFVGLGGIALAGWFWAIRDLYVAQRIAPDADPGRQLAFISAHPIRYASVLLADLCDNGARYASHCTGYGGRIPRIFGWLHLGAAFLGALVDGRRDAAVDARGKVVLVLVLATTYALVNTLNYLAWNGVGARTIQFVQGRYYIPILPLLFLLLSNRRLASLVPERSLTLLSACVTLSSSAVAIRYFALRG